MNADNIMFYNHKHVGFFNGIDERYRYFPKKKMRIGMKKYCNSLNAEINAVYKEKMLQRQHLESRSMLAGDCFHIGCVDGIDVEVRDVGQALTHKRIDKTAQIVNNECIVTLKWPKPNDFFYFKEVKCEHV